MDIKRKLAKLKLETEPALLTKLRKEVSKGPQRLLEMFPMYTEAAIASKGADYFNIPGTALSLLLHTAEKRCVLALRDFWEERGVHFSALIQADGMHVDKDAATAAMLPLAAKHIEAKTGYRAVELA